MHTECNEKEEDGTLREECLNTMHGRREGLARTMKGGSGKVKGKKNSFYSMWGKNQEA